MVNGRLHWQTCLARSCDILSFDFEDELFRVVRKPNSLGLRTLYYLMELRGYLSAVKFVQEIWVMNEYDVKKSWIKEFSIGSYVQGLKRR